MSNRTSVNSSKSGAYAGIFNHLNLSGMNNPSPNLTTVYLDMTLVGPTTDPLKQFILPVHLGQPNGYPLIRTVGGY